MAASKAAYTVSCTMLSVTSRIIATIGTPSPSGTDGCLESSLYISTPSKYPVGSALSVGSRPFHQNMQSGPLCQSEVDRSIKICSRVRFVCRNSTVPSKYPVGGEAVVQNAMFLENIPVLSLVLSPTGAVGWLPRKQLIQFPVRCSQ